MELWVKGNKQHPLTWKEMDFSSVKAAAARLAGVVHRTPIHYSRMLDEHSGNQVLLKCENFQRAGAFKIRGAYNTMSQMSEEAKAAGVLTYSSGNHAQAVALAGGLLGIQTRVIMPDNAPPVKIQATKGYGAEVLHYDPARTEREDLAKEILKDTGMTLVPPFDHPHVIAGQGTAALELLEEAGSLDAVLTPCGGGGLLSGTAVTVKHLQPGCRVMGVEPEGANNGNLSFLSGKIERVEHPQTMADGLKPKSLGEHTLQAIRTHVDGMFMVSEEEIKETLAFLWQRMKLLVEPSGAVGLAAVFHGKTGLQGKRIGVILSGGNADIGAVADWFRR